MLRIVSGTIRVYLYSYFDYGVNEYVVLQPYTCPGGWVVCPGSGCPVAARSSPSLRTENMIKETPGADELERVNIL